MPVPTPYGTTPPHETLSRELGRIRTDLRNLDTKASKKVCQVRKTGAQTLSNGAGTFIDWAVYRDDWGMFSTPSGRSTITVAEPGWWYIAWRAQWQQGATGGIRDVRVYKGATYTLDDILLVDGMPGTAITTTESDLVYIADADTPLTFWAVQTSGGNLDFGAGTSATALYTMWTVAQWGG